MRTITKSAASGHPGWRSPLSDAIGHVRRALAATTFDRRQVRPLQDIDFWSDQAEVAYYESFGLGRSQ